MERLFICQIVPPSFVRKNKYISQAANNFSYNFIEAVQPKSVFSFIPVFVSERIFGSFDIRNVYVFQSRMFPHLLLGKGLNVLMDNIHCICKTFFKTGFNTHIWFYNLYSYHFVLAYVVLKYVLRRKCFFVIADYMPTSANRLLKKLVDKSDGIVSFSEQFNIECSNKNVKVFPGLVTSEPEVYGSGGTFSSTILFSGRLEHYTGLDLALKVFSELPSFKLIVTGEGSLRGLVKDYQRRFDNIVYLGYLEYDEYLEVLKSVSVCLSLRNPSHIENRYSFPSKILEYMCNGKLVISTMTYSSVPKDYIFYSSYDTESVKQHLLSIQAFSDSELSNKAEAIQKFSVDNFSKKALIDVVDQIEKACK
jgi:glycosyltransferase involved in cell wall biosynthesis